MKFLPIAKADWKGETMCEKSKSMRLRILTRPSRCMMGGLSYEPEGGNIA